MRPAVGVGVFIMNKEMNQFLMAQRKDCDKVALMGGHLERFEEVNETAQREVLEESNLSIPLEKEYPKVFNSINKETNYHFITYFSVAVIPDGQIIKNTEPHKQGDWEWVGEEDFTNAHAQKKLFFPLEKLFKACNEDFSELLKILQSLFQ